MFSDQLGRIFISYSSADKPFVRRLAKRLELAGYSIWLDEKELRAGDALGERIANALNTSPVVVVVASSNSIKSKWLRYELNIATERMVKGECRVIPVVIDDVNLPSEVIGLLYADFRGRFGQGLKAVISAVEHEKRRRLAMAPVYAKVDNAVRKVFDGIANVSTVGGYKDKDWALVSVPVPSPSDPKETSVYYDWVSSYAKKPKPLSSSWLCEFHEFVDQTGEPLSLVVTDQEVGFSVTRLSSSHPQLSFVERFAGREITVFVELGSVHEEQWTEVLSRARELLIEFAHKLSGAATSSR